MLKFRNQHNFIDERVNGLLCLQEQPFHSNNIIAWQSTLQILRNDT